MRSHGGHGRRGQELTRSGRRFRLRSRPICCGTVWRALRSVNIPSGVEGSVTIPGTLAGRHGTEMNMKRLTRQNKVQAIQASARERRTPFGHGGEFGVSPD